MARSEIPSTQEEKMNKAKLVEIVGRVVSTRKEALSAVDAMLNAVQHALRSGDKVVLAGIGSFHVKMRKAKIGRNPKTGVVVPIPPRRAVRFKMSKDLFSSKSTGPNPSSFP